MKNRLKIVTAIAVTMFAVTACGGSGSSADDNVAWVDKVCGASLNAVKSLSTEPNLDMSDPSKLKSGFSEWLGTGAAQVDKSIKELEGLKSGPSKDSEKLATAAIDVFTKLKNALDEAKATIDAVDPTDTAAVAEAFSKVGTQMADFSKVAADFEGTFAASELAEAEKKAKNCQELQSGSSSTPSS